MTSNFSSVEFSSILEAEAGAIRFRRSKIADGTVAHLRGKSRDEREYSITVAAFRSVARGHLGWRAN